MAYGAARRSRLEAVASTYLRRPQSRACQVLVASAEESSLLRPVSAVLQQASTAMGFDTGVLGHEPGQTSVESAAAEPRLWIVEASGVREEWLPRLEPPGGKGPELLLWLQNGSKASLRESYLFGMLRWSLSPVKSVVLVMDAEPAVLAELLALNQPDAEVVALPFARDLPLVGPRLMQQLLESALARAGSARRRPFRLGPAARA